MSYLRAKSEFNLNAAQVLIDQNLYAPSVHCSYYASFQFLKYTIKNYLGLDYAYIEAQCKASPFGTHGYIIKLSLDEFRKVATVDEHKDLKRYINDLKEFRIDSDYYNKEIIIDQSEKSLRLSKSIILEIKTKLK